MPNITSDTPVGTLPGGTTVTAVATQSGRNLLTTVDDFVSNQSRFDRQARVNLRYDVLAVTESVYLDYVASQVMAWSDSEIESLKKIVTSISGKFARLSLPLPSDIYLVKTTGLEEGYAAYTRGMNIISLPANMVASLETAVNHGDPLHPADDLTYLEDVIIHEHFHLFSKNNETKRYQLYQLVGYYPTGNNIALPNVPWGPTTSAQTMPEMKITNPDTPDLNVFIELDVSAIAPNEVPFDAAKVPLTPILLSSQPYAGGVFFDTLQWWFLAVAQQSDGTWAPILQPNGEPYLFDSSRLMDQYRSIIGYNLSGELFHPDEILAQNFVFIANQPDAQLLAAMHAGLIS